MTICISAGCTNIVYVRDLCRAHYKRILRKTGFPKKVFPSAEVRFHNSYEILAETGCWIWMKATTSTGYGSFCVRKGVMEKAHRWSMRNLGQQNIQDMFVLHRCDTPLCVNPKHLFVGTQADNLRDMDSKNRRRTKSKLSEADVLAIRQDGRTHRQIAKSYNISFQHVSDLKLHKRRVM